MQQPPLPMFRLALLFSVCLGAAFAARAEPVRSEHTEAELVASVKTVAPGEPFWIALRLRMDPHWHTYWKNPGAAGLATEIQWTKIPDGMEIGGIHWPTPKVFEQAGIVNYVYEGEVYLMMKARPPESLSAGETLVLEARADWLECDDALCLPGGASLSLTLSAGDEAEPDREIAEALAGVRAKSWPQTSPLWEASAAYTGERVTLTLTPRGDAKAHNPVGVTFFSANGFIAPGAEQVTRQGADGGLRIEMEVDTYYTGPNPPKTLPGVVRSGNGWGADGEWLGLEIDPALSGPADGAGGNGGDSAEHGAGSTGAGANPAMGLAPMLGLAFLGGLILNLMPCVFPVLGLKIMGFVNQAGEERGKIAGHGFVYTLGVLLSFWVLAGVLIALRAGGEELGWGFQLQNPGFVLALAVLLLVFGLNLSGVFEIGHSAVGVGASLTSKRGYSGSFFSGVLATVVATPCAAPFLAPALGAALTLPPAPSIGVFTVIGLGLAFPYLLLSFFPQLASRLPKPGAWMESFKQFMAFLLYATVVALVWVLAGQLASDPLLVTLFSLVMVALGCWVFGRWGQPHRHAGARAAAMFFAGLLIVGGPVYAWGSIRAAEARQAEIEAAKASGEALDFLVWEPWSPEEVEKLRAEGRPVYIDFTARWCATCQVNKRVYQNEALVEKFQQYDVATLKADWTNKDPAITRALAEFNRSAVPFNLLYVPGEAAPVILPEVLTAGNVKDALDKIPGA